MSEQFLQHLDTIKNKSKNTGVSLKRIISNQKLRISKLILDEKFWKDQLNAQKILKEKKLDDLVSSFKDIQLKNVKI